MARRPRNPSRPIQPRREPRRRENLPVIVGAAVALLVLAAVAAIAISASSSRPGVSSAPTARTSPSSAAAPSAPPASSTSPEASLSVADIKCESTEQVAYHVHAHLAIVVDGKAEVVPEGIGIGDLCLFWLHTHATSGIIHVEAPAPADFRLGQFFDVWGKPLDDANLGPYRVPSGEHLYAFVDGVPWTADPRSIPLLDHAIIELQVGAAPIQPSQYEFPAGY